MRRSNKNKKKLRFLIKEYEKDRFGESNFSNWNMIDELDNRDDEEVEQ